jgi:hypothetical protein
MLPTSRSTLLFTKMFNPLTPDLTQLSDAELAEKIETLWQRAYQMRYHPAHQQLQALINSYTQELQNRQNSPRKSTI